MELSFSGYGLPSNDEIAESSSMYKSVLETAIAGEERFSDILGWLYPDKWAGGDTLETIETLAEKIRIDADVFVVVGIGGSINAARAIVEALQKENSPEILFMGNTLSPKALSDTLKKLEGKNFYVDCIAKNFETLEPGASFRVLRKILQDRYGDEASQHIITTGTPGTHFEKLSNEQGFTFLTFPPDIGGRFTALSNVGLLPMAVAGVDIRQLVQGASNMQKRLFSEPYEENIALKYACARNLLYKKGYKLEMMSSFEPQLRCFYQWWIQVFAESEGKDNKGLYPISGMYSEDLHSVGQYVQDGENIIFETFLTFNTSSGGLTIPVGDYDDGFDYIAGMDFAEINNAALDATIRAHSEKLPIINLKLEDISPESFGQMIYFFQLSCYLSGVILGVNPFDQPGVEAYKGWMFKNLGKN